MSSYKCPKCNDNFKYKSILKRHLQNSVRCISSNEYIDNFFIQNANIVNANILQKQLNIMMIYLKTYSFLMLIQLHHQVIKLY